MKEGVYLSARINLALICTYQLWDLAESRLYILFDSVIKIIVISLTH